MPDPSATFPRPTAGLLLGLAGVTIFAGTLPMTHLALGSFPPLFVAAGRAAVASALAAMALFVIPGRGPVPKRSELGALFLAGLCVTLGFPGFTALAMQTESAAHGGVVLGILPLMTAAFAALVAGERPGRAFMGWSLLGAALVVLFAVLTSGFRPGLGDLWLLLAAIAAGLGYALLGRASRMVPGWAAISWALVLTAPLSLPLAATALPDDLGAVSPVSWAAFAYLSAGSMFAGFMFWNAGLALGGIARVGQVQLLQIFLTIGWSAALLGEPVTILTLAFAAAVALTVWMARQAKR